MQLELHTPKPYFCFGVHVAGFELGQLEITRLITPWIVFHTVSLPLHVILLELKQLFFQKTSMLPAQKGRKVPGEAGVSKTTKREGTYGDCFSQEDGYPSNTEL